MAQVYESDLSPKERRQKEWQTIKNLKGKKRLEYLWAYYKFVLVILIIAILAGYMVYTMVSNMNRNKILSVAVVDSILQDQETIDQMETDLLEYIGAKGKHDEVQIDASISSAEDQANTTKLTLSILPTGENDIVICGQEVYDRFKEQGAFTPIEEILGGSYSEYEEFMTNGEIDLSKCEEWNDIITYSPAYVCVLADSGHPDETLAFLSYLTGK